MHNDMSIKNRVSIRNLFPLIIVSIAFSCSLAYGFYALSGLILSDDQISYWYRASEIITHNFSIRYWNPTATFSYLLGFLYLVLHNVKWAFLFIFGCISVLYCVAMTLSIKIFLKNELLSLGIAIISLIPVYTLGMTYWGFGSFDMVRGRILIMPIAPLVIVWFYEKRNSGKIWIPLVLCSLAGVIHLEIIYLAIILSVVLFWLHYQIGIDKKIFTQTLLPIALSGIVICGIYFIPKIVQSYLGPNPTTVLFHWLTLSREYYSDYINQLSNHAYLKLQWEASKSAFWWTMFPPRLTDIVYVAVSSFFLFFFGTLGLLEIKKKNYELFKFILIFLVATLSVAYGYQFIRYIGRFLWGASPKIWEEVRAVKFIYFFIYLSIGFLFKKWLVEKKFGLIVIASILIVFSPIQILTVLPTQWKERLITHTSTIFRQPYLTEYFRKALKIVDVKQERDLKAIEGIFAKEVKTDRRTYALTDIHSLKQSGLVTLISYQDKRSSTSQINREDPLPYWYLAYNEISQALRSGNSEKVLQTAKKYQCEWVVSYQKLSDKNLIPRYEGEELFLYQVSK